MPRLLGTLFALAFPLPLAAAENQGGPEAGVFSDLPGVSAESLRPPAPPCPPSPRFTVDPDNAIWVGCEPKMLFNSSSSELFSIDRPFGDFLWLESGEFVVSSGMDVGFLEPASGAPGKDGAHPLVYRPAVSMRHPVRLYSGQRGGLYLAAKRPDGTEEISWMEIGGGGKEGRLISLGSATGPVNAIAGDGRATYFARGRDILRRSASGEEHLSRHDSEEIADLAYSAEGSLFLATASGVGVLRGTTMFGLMKAAESFIRIRGDSLYVVSARHATALRIQGLTNFAQLGEQSLMEAGAKVLGVAVPPTQNPPPIAPPISPPKTEPSPAGPAPVNTLKERASSESAPDKGGLIGGAAVLLILSGIGVAFYSMKIKRKAVVGAGSSPKTPRPTPAASGPTQAGTETEDWPAEEFVTRFREAVKREHYGRAQDLFSRVELILPLAHDPVLYYEFALLAEKSESAKVAARIYKRFIAADIDYKDVIERYGALKKGLAPGAPPPAVPAEIGGQFEIRNPIGEGGMGLVYLGFDRKLGRQVAIKKMRPEVNADPEGRKSFLEEARIISQLTHPYIVGIHAVLEHAGEIYLVFDFVDGKPLSAVIAEKRRLPLAECRRFFQQVCEAIDCAHRARVLHRDLKPSNIMMDSNGFAKVMDFGLARQIQETVSRTTTAGNEGTPAYMAPEQHLGRVSRASDIYALGICIYESLTGALPFPGPDYLAQKERMKFTPPQFLAPELPKETELLMSAAFAPNPRHRVADAMELFNLLKNCHEPEG